MRFGIWTPRGGKADESVDDCYRFAVEVAQKAESLGFETTLVAQRYLGLDLDAWVLASALAAQTKSIELLIAIHPGVLTPQVVAKMGATLDHISGGRFAINLVNGWWQEEMEVYGNGGWIDRTDERYRRMAEYVQVVKGMWGDAPFTHAGEFFRVATPASPMKPVQKFPPFYTASSSDAGKEIIARLCEYWFIAYEAGYQNYERNMAHFAERVREMHERSARHGRTVHCAVSANVICADTTAEAEAIVADIEHRSSDRKIGGTAVAALGAGLIGSAQTIADRINRYEEIGVHTLMLRFPNMLPGLDRFGREVLPLLRPSREQGLRVVGQARTAGR